MLFRWLVDVDQTGQTQARIPFQVPSLGILFAVVMGIRLRSATTGSA